MPKILHHDRYMYMHHIDNGDVSISVKLDDDGVVIDVWKGDRVIASTWKTYAEFGLEVKELEI